MRNFSISVGIAAVGALLLAGCASPGSSASTNAAKQDIGTQISQNLVTIHEQYCSGTPDANARLAVVKSKGAPLRVVDEKTGKTSRIWFIKDPSTTQRGTLFTDTWGVYLKEPEETNGCGVGYVRPDQLDTLKGGKSL